MSTALDILRRAAGMAPPAQNQGKAWPLAGIRRSGLETIAYSGAGYFPLVGDVHMTYEQMYRTQPWVHVCVNKLSRGIARLPLKAYSRVDEDRMRLARSHALAHLIRRPNPGTGTQALLEATVGSLALYGNAIWAKFRPGPGQPPSELWPLDWRGIEIVGGDRRPIDHYVYHGAAGERRFHPQDVVHFHWWAPGSEAGISPLEALRRTLSLEDATQRDAIASFENAVTPSGALSTDQHLTDTQLEALQAVINARHAGPENARRMMLLEGGLTYQPFSQTAEESQAIEFRKLSREEVAAVYDIPPPVIGILDHATFANISEQHLMLYMDTLGPWLTHIEEALGVQLIEPEPAWGDLFVEFDLGEVLKGNIKERSEAYARFINAGVYTPNELRALENRPPAEGGDDLLVPQNLRRASSPDTTEAPEQLSLPVSESDDEDDDDA